MRKVLLQAAVLFLATQVVVMGEEASQSHGEYIKRLAELGPGVHKVQKDDAGRMRSCMVVGQSRISSVLGTAKGLEVAQSRARLSAEAAFVKWMGNSVRAIETLSDETIVYLEGSDDALSESGKATEVNAINITTLAEGVVRGLVVIGFGEDAESETLTIVLGWSPQNAALAQQVRDINEERASGVAGDTRPKRIPLRSKTVVSEDFGEFMGQ